MENTTVKEISVRYDHEIGGIISTLIGPIDSADVDVWAKELLTTIEKHTPEKKFTLLLNVHGYRPTSPSVHFKYSMFLKTNPTVTTSCRAVAHVHHDPQHIETFIHLMDDFQGFFTDYDEAYDWLKARRDR